MQIVFRFQLNYFRSPTDFLIAIKNKTIKSFKTEAFYRVVLKLLSYNIRLCSAFDFHEVS